MVRGDKNKKYKETLLLLLDVLAPESSRSYKHWPGSAGSDIIFLVLILIWEGNKHWRVNTNKALSSLDWPLQVINVWFGGWTEPDCNRGPQDFYPSGLLKRTRSVALELPQLVEEEQCLLGFLNYKLNPSSNNRKINAISFFNMFIFMLKCFMKLLKHVLRRLKDKIFSFFYVTTTR